MIYFSLKKSQYRDYLPLSFWRLQYNIKIQRAGRERSGDCSDHIPAADLVR
jgi:hypothetical protein